MHICDLSRNEEVVGTVILKITNAEGEQSEQEIEVGASALGAFERQDWRALNELIPKHLRPKDPNRVAGAAKAAETRAAVRAAAAGKQELPPPVGRSAE